MGQFQRIIRVRRSDTLSFFVTGFPPAGVTTTISRSFAVLARASRLRVFALRAIVALTVPLTLERRSVPARRFL